MIAGAPQVADLRWTLCSHYRRQGLPDEALPQCEQAVQLAPDSPEAHTNLGNALADLGRLDDAKGHLEVALSLDGDSAVTHNDLGALLGRGGDWAGAVRHFERAVELDPEMTSAQRNLGQVYLSLGQVERAVPILREAVRDRKSVV